jgi:hypothetical protein
MTHSIIVNLQKKTLRVLTKTGTLKVVRSSEPSDGQNLQMFGGFTFSRHAIHPVEDPKLSNDPDIKKYNIDLNRFNSVRCAVNY